MPSWFERHFNWEEKHNLYWDVVEAVQLAGSPVSPRGVRTRELLNVSVTAPMGWSPSREGMNNCIGWAEALMLLTGTFEPDVLRRVAPKADHSLFTFGMAYGPKMGGQLHQAIRRLEEDRDTRQAIIMIGDHLYEYSEIPCTTSMQFLVRRGVLHVTVNMRSWDLVRGLPYDVTMFSMLGSVVALELGVPRGNLTVNAASAHVYETDTRLLVDHLPERFWDLPKPVPVSSTYEKWMRFDRWYVKWARQELDRLTGPKGGHPLPEGVEFREVRR